MKQTIIVDHGKSFSLKRDLIDKIKDFIDKNPEKFQSYVGENAEARREAMCFVNDMNKRLAKERIAAAA